MSRFLVLTLSFVVFLVSSAVAAEPGRYRAISLPREGDMDASVLIIDTETGDVWKWYEGGGGSGKAPGTGIRYEGRVVPGDSPGESVARQGFGLPAFQRPALRR
jgi:hypothetical protein